ncbi:MAG: ABC transporter ATP-binding protein [Promethearchaeota archaeon]
MLLECKDLIKIYPSPVEGLMFPALRGLDLKVQMGELISLIGPSGAGKSTLLRLICTFDQPSSGEIRFDGKLVNTFTDSELEDYRLNEVGVMYQAPEDNLIWSFDSLQNVMLPMRYSGKFGGNEKDRANELLEKVGLKGKGHRKPSQLSGGEQQRVAIAVALANNPKLLLADEPTGELDSGTTAVIIDYFKQLNTDDGLTILVATHDKRFVKMTNRTYKILDGRLTTYHIRSKKSLEIDLEEEIVIVDSQGNLRLPREVFHQFKDLTAVKVQVKNGKIELIPFIDKLKKNQRDQK